MDPKYLDNIPRRPNFSEIFQEATDKMNEVFVNFTLLDQIVKLHNYLNEKFSIKDGSYTFNGDLEVSFDAKKAIYHTWDTSYHNGDHYNFQKTELSNTELEEKLRYLYQSLRSKALRKAETDVVRQLAENKLQELGI